MNSSSPIKKLKEKFLKIKKEIRDRWSIDIKDRNICEYWNQSNLQTWEVVLLVISTYIIHIVNLFRSTIKYEAFGIKTTDNFWVDLKVYPLNQEVFWILISKCLLGLLFWLYFSTRCKGNRKIFQYITFFLIWSCLFPTLDLLEYIGLGFVGSLAKLIMAIGFVYYFFAIDKTNLDSSHVLLYDEVIVYEDVQRVVRVPGSRRTKARIKNLINWSLLIFAFSIIGSITINAIYQAIKNVSGGVGGDSDKSKNQEKLEKVMRSGILNLILMGIQAIILAPINEEFIFRKCVMKLDNFGWSGWLLSGFSFGIMHLNNEPIHVLFPYAIAGLCLGAIMKYKRNIWYSICAHGINNLFVFLIFIFRGNINF